MPTWRSISNYDLFECFMLLTAVKHGRGSRKQCINVILVKFSRSFEQQPVFDTSCHVTSGTQTYGRCTTTPSWWTSASPLVFLLKSCGAHTISTAQLVSSVWPRGTSHPPPPPHLPPHSNSYKGAKSMVRSLASQSCLTKEWSGEDTRTLNAHHA